MEMICNKSFQLEPNQCHSHCFLFANLKKAGLAKEMMSRGRRDWKLFKTILAGTYDDPVVQLCYSILSSCCILFISCTYAHKA